jgi:branched-subunit amino acid aminotransferase/4-amino-4-deoxychorismate lyase
MENTAFGQSLMDLDVHIDRLARSVDSFDPDDYSEQELARILSKAIRMYDTSEVLLELALLRLPTSSSQFEERHMRWLSQ